MEKTKNSLGYGIMIFVLGAVSTLEGCTTSPKLASGGLQFTNGMTEEPQLSKAIARFCDSAYIAVNQSQEITPFDVMRRFEAIRVMRKSWSSDYAVAELVKASLISNKGIEVVYERYIELEKKLGDQLSGEFIAELTKVSVITESDASLVASVYKSFKTPAKKWESKASPVELTKLSLFTERDVNSIYATLAEFSTRQGKIGGEKELIELTKSATLTGRSPNDLVKLFDQIETIDKGWVSRAGTAELVKIAILTNYSPKTVYYRYTEILAKKQKHGEDKALELLKLSLIGKRSSKEVTQLYDRFLGMDTVTQTKEQAKPKTLSLITGELLQDSVFGNQVDECNGGYARLILSIDSYRYDEG